MFADVGKCESVRLNAHRRARDFLLSIKVTITTTCASRCQLQKIACVCKTPKNSTADGVLSAMSSDIKEDHQNSTDCQTQNQDELSSKTHSNKTVSESSPNLLTREFNSSKSLSWHEHVYKKLTNKPTPHYIENILGIQSNKTSQLQDLTLHKTNKMTVSETVLTQDKFSKVHTSVTPVNEPLNLSIRSDLKVRSKILKGKKSINFE